MLVYILRRCNSQEMQQSGDAYIPNLLYVVTLLWIAQLVDNSQEE